MDIDSGFRFYPARRFHVSVEEAVWTADPKSGALVSGALRMFSAGQENRWSGLKSESPFRQITAVTPLCRTLFELKEALKRNETLLDQAARQYGFLVSRAPVQTAPFVGLHIHVGLGTTGEAVSALNVIRLHLPRFLDLSARDGANFREHAVEFPEDDRTADETVPPFLRDWDHFLFLADIHRFGSDRRLCRWSVRICPFGTVELRICDVQEKIGQTLALMALMRVLTKLAVGAAKAGYSPREIAPEKIAETLKAAAFRRLDNSRYLSKIRRIAERGNFAEERLYLAELTKEL